MGNTNLLGRGLRILKFRWPKVLGLYVFVFLADDIAMVVLALVTLRVGAMDRGYARWVRLAGGVLMLSLGLILIFRPAWLSLAIA